MSQQRGGEKLKLNVSYESPTFVFLLFSFSSKTNPLRVLLIYSYSFAFHFSRLFYYRLVSSFLPLSSTILTYTPHAPLHTLPLPSPCPPDFPLHPTLYLQPLRQIPIIRNGIAPRLAFIADHGCHLSQLGNHALLKFLDQLHRPIRLV